MEVTLILYIVYVVALTILALITRKIIGTAAKDLDGRWDLIDIVKVLWLILFPVGFLSTLFLGLAVTPVIWQTMDIIFFLLIVKDGKDAYFAYLNKKHDNEVSNNPEPPSPNELS